jgi:predicted RND superfamily exporter protein
MWESTGRFVLKFRFPLLTLLLGLSLFMAWEAAKVQLSYEFTNAIPTDNPKFKAYQSFRSRFGEDGNLMVIGLQSDRFYTPDLFNDYRLLTEDLKKIQSVEDVLSIPTTVKKTAARKSWCPGPSSLRRHFLPKVSTVAENCLKAYPFTRDSCMHLTALLTWPECGSTNRC